MSKSLTSCLTTKFGILARLLTADGALTAERKQVLASIEEEAMLEKDIEQACRRHAESVGAILLKIQGNKGWPDRLLLFNGHMVFIEFKKPGAKPSPLQQHILNELKIKGHMTCWMTSLLDFKVLLGNLTFIKSVALPGYLSEYQLPSFSPRA